MIRARPEATGRSALLSPASRLPPPLTLPHPLRAGDPCLTLASVPDDTAPPPLVVRPLGGANCSSVGSVVDLLFVTATVGGALLVAVSAALAPAEPAGPPPAEPAPPLDEDPP